MIEQFNYNNTKITKRTYPVSEHISEDNRKDCFCCNKEVVGCSGTLLTGDYSTIPNILLHTECYEKWRGREEKLFNDIFSAYKDWKKLDRVFGSRLKFFTKEDRFTTKNLEQADRIYEPAEEQICDR